MINLKLGEAWVQSYFFDVHGKLVVQFTTCQEEAAEYEAYPEAIKSVITKFIEVPVVVYYWIEYLIDAGVFYQTVRCTSISGAWKAFAASIIDWSSVRSAKVHSTKNETSFL